MNPMLKLAGLAAAITLLVEPVAAQQKLTMFYPSVLRPNTEGLMKDWAAKVEAQSKGAVAIDVKGNSPLAHFGNVVNRVETDVIQIGIALTSIFPGKFDLTNVVSLPFTINLDDDDQASAAVWRLYETGALASEYKTLVPIFMGVSKQSGFHFTKAPPSLDNLSGLKIRIYNNLQLDMVKSLGMSAVSMPPRDLYQAVQRGTVDGTITSWTTFPFYKLSEILKYHVELPLGGSVLMAFMARKKLDSLPSAGRDAILANANEAFSRRYGKVLGEDAARGKEMSSGPDHTIIQATPERTAEWRRKFGLAMVEKWKGMHAPHGEKVLAAFKKIYADVRAGR